MRITRVIGLMMLSVAASAPVFAQAQQPAPPTTPRAWSETGSGYRAYVMFDQVSFTAKDSFDAVLGKSSLSATGVGGEFRFWKGLFVRGSYSAMKETGERAFVVGGQVIPVGIPLTVEMKPFEFSVGWRLPLDRSERFVAYGGGGSLYVKYRETSDFAEPGENIDEGFTVAEIAEILNTSSDRVKANLWHGRRHLRQRLGDVLGGSPDWRPIDGLR